MKKADWFNEMIDYRLRNRRRLPKFTWDFDALIRGGIAVADARIAEQRARRAKRGAAAHAQP